MAKLSLTIRHYILPCLQVVIYIYLRYIRKPTLWIQNFLILLSLVSILYYLQNLRKMQSFLLFICLIIAPAFALSISQFSDRFFPEILGVTLLVEWTVLEAVPIIKLFKYYGLNPYFYEMHVAIDNASTGHGKFFFLSTLRMRIFKLHQNQMYLFIFI